MSTASGLSGIQAIVPPGSWTYCGASVELSVTHGGGGGSGGLGWLGGGERLSRVKLHTSPSTQSRLVSPPGCMSTRQCTVASGSIRPAGGAAMLLSLSRVATCARLVAALPAIMRCRPPLPEPRRNIKSASSLTAVAPSGGTGDEARHAMRPGIQYSSPGPTGSYAPMPFCAHTEPGLGRKSRLRGSRSCSKMAPAELFSERSTAKRASTCDVDGSAAPPPTSPRKPSMPLPSITLLAFS